VARREMLGWQRGETTATPGILMEYNGLSGERIAERAMALLG